MTARPLTSTATTVSSVPRGWYDVTAYGAIGDGSADDTTAIQNAINACKTTPGKGGVVWLPPGVYKITTSLQLGSPNQDFRYHFMGAGAGSVASAGRGTTLHYTGGAGAGPMLACKSIAGVELSHFGVEYAAGFDGNLIDVEGYSAGPDAIDFHIHHVTSMATGTVTAHSIIRLAQAIIGQIDHCHLTGADYPILYDPTHYVISVTVADCTFNIANIAMIGLLSGDAENPVIERCVFEAGTSTTAIDGGAVCQLYSPVIRDCWFGDAGAATTWIKNLTAVNANYPGMISGCRFADNLGGVHMDKLKNSWLVMQNSMEGGSAFGDASQAELVLIANAQPNGNWWTTGPPNGVYQAFGNVGVSLPNNSGAQMSFGMPGGFAINLDMTHATGPLVLGHTAAPYVTTGTKTALYSDGNGNINVQSRSDLNSYEVQLVAGSTPAAVIRASGAAVGFYGHAPASRPAAYTLNAGATSRNLASGGTLANVEQTLRQLITDLQANGLLQ